MIAIIGGATLNLDTTPGTVKLQKISQCSSKSSDAPDIFPADPSAFNARAIDPFFPRTPLKISLIIIAALYHLISDLKIAFTDFVLMSEKPKFPAALKVRASELSFLNHGAPM